MAPNVLRKISLDLGLIECTDYFPCKLPFLILTRSLHSRYCSPILWVGKLRLRGRDLLTAVKREAPGSHLHPSPPPHTHTLWKEVPLVTVLSAMRDPSHPRTLWSVLLGSKPRKHPGSGPEYSGCSAAAR